MHTLYGLDSTDYRLLEASYEMHERVSTSIGYCPTSVFVILNQSHDTFLTIRMAVRH